MAWDPSKSEPEEPSEGLPAIRYLRPDALLLDPHTLLKAPVLVVRGSYILEVHRDFPGRWVTPEAFPGELWVAAPLLLHAHLESYDAPSSLWRRESFAQWVSHLLAWREEERLPAPESAWHSLEELRIRGCGLVFTHAGEPQSNGRHFPSWLEAPQFPEVLAAPELFEPDPEQVHEPLKILDQRPPRPGTGLALHAPYSVSETLAKAVFARGRGWAVPVSIHLGEHPEERQFLASGQGPLADCFRDRGRPLKKQRWDSPVAWLQDVGGLHPGTLAVHCGDLDLNELESLAAAGVRMVWCPGTHLYFDRPPVLFGRSDIPLPALGCDSRASNASLDPLREYRLANALAPEAGPVAWWQALTEGGAAALGRGDLGSLGPGKRARFLRLAHEPAKTAEEVCQRLAREADLRPLAPVCEPGHGLGPL